MIIYTPSYPLPGGLVSLTLSQGEARQFVLTGKPAESDLHLGSLLQPNGEPAHAFWPDVPGKYTFDAQIVGEFNAPPTYEGDPIGAHRLEFVSIDQGSVVVGESLELPIQLASGRSCAIQIDVHDDWVTDAKITTPSDNTVAAAVQGAAIASALEVLRGTIVPSLGANLIDRTGELLAAYEGHRANAGGVWHLVDADRTTGDQVNKILRFPPASVDAAVRTIADISTVLFSHMESGINASIRWHGIDDNAAPALTVRPSDLATAVVHLAEITERVFKRHAARTTDDVGNFVHAQLDTVNVLTAPSPLTLAIVAIVDALGALDIQPVSGQVSGALAARSRYGFEN